ncbi:tellurite resistance TerB family protein [Flavobacterium sinopsychrotolerans]|uniref:Tellurite resistance protein TerB n=1 Tax=Flavobacterium sinopsychrotolerans TaxID=604089 RepID=A0A1H8KY53_9FLAO|nr:tellurite resistance TerB family protein [Flavobacterium sinopsychrotolerans]SEN97832.1 Tellurite resistance protein TerB [Flavobacterium sinopsychrotolerans]
MNPFENNNSSQNTVNSEFEAWVGILYSCISADNQITDSETATLSRVLSSKHKFIGIDIAPLYRKAFNVRAELGQLKYISACSEWIKGEDKETVFVLALEVLLADGTLEKEEKNVIEVLSNQLEIEKEMTSKIIEVIFLKNKGNIKGI